MAALGAAASQAAKLIDTAAAAMRRKINIFTSSRGQAGSNGVRWTRAEGVVLIESIIEEAVFTEAADSGTTASDLHALHTNLLAMTMDALADIQWKDSGGFQKISEHITAHEMEIKLAALLRASEIKMATAEGETKEALRNLCSKATDALTAARAFALQTTSNSDQLKDLVIQFERVTATRDGVQAEMAELWKGREGNTTFKRDLKTCKTALQIATAATTAAYSAIQLASANIEREGARRITGDSPFALHTFNSLAAQFNAFETAAPHQHAAAAPQTASAAAAQTHTPSSSHTEKAVRARVAKSWKSDWGSDDAEWTAESTDMTKGLWLYAAADVWLHTKKLPGADSITRQELLARTSLDSELTVPEMLQDFFKEINKPRLTSSIHDELTRAANADRSNELKLKRIADLLQLLEKLQQGAAVVDWAGPVADELAWDSLQRLINGMREQSLEKQKLMEMSATLDSDKITMSQVRNLCRTTDISCDLSKKRLASAEPDGQQEAKRFLHQLESKNVCCSYCSNFGHERAECRKFAASQAHHLQQGNLIQTNHQGQWNQNRWARQQGGQAGQQFQQTAPQPAAQNSQTAPQTTTAAPAGQQTSQNQQFGQDGGTAAGGTFNGGQSRGGGKGSYSYSNSSRGKGMSFGCFRCGSNDHPTGACQQPDVRVCHNCGQTGHIRWHCRAPLQQ